MSQQRNYKIKTYQLIMMVKRGYSIPDNEKNIWNRIDGQIKDFDSMSNVYIKGNKKAFVFYIEDAKLDAVRQKLVSVETDTTNKKETDDIIIITKSEKVDNKISQTHKNIQIFNDKSFLYDPTEHYLNPKFQLLSEEEKNTFLKDNNLTVKHLPGIKKHDPISMYYGAKVDDVFKIYRKSLFYYVVNDSIAYRIVVS